MHMISGKRMNFRLKSRFAPKDRFFANRMQAVLLALAIAMLLSACGDGGSVETNFGYRERGPMPSVAGQLVISEIMADPDVIIDDQGEWFELFNPSYSQVLGLKGCFLESALGTVESREIVADFHIQAREYATLARDPAPGFVPDIVVGIFMLNNTTVDEIQLTCDGVAIDVVQFSEPANGFTATVTSGASLSVKTANMNATANDTYTGNYCLGTSPYDGNGNKGTPGGPNDC